MPRTFVSRYDIVVDGCDNFQTRYIISDVCAAQRKPYVFGAITELDGQVSVLCSGNATFRSLYPEQPEPSSKAVVGVTPGVVGMVEANQVLQLICGYGEPLTDRLWTINLRYMQSFIIKL